MDEPFLFGRRGASSTAAVDEWKKFLSRSLVARLDVETFQTYVTILHSKCPLPPVPVADIFLRPQPANHDLLDPRVPRYLQVLLQLKYIDSTSILKALYRYSTSHVQSQGARQNGEVQGKGQADVLRWGSSYGAEEVIFYRLTKGVAQGTGIRTPMDAVAVAKIMARWMKLFTTASAAFAADVMGQLQNSSSRDEMESARAAFVMLLLGVCENQVVLGALSKPVAKGEDDPALSG